MASAPVPVPRALPEVTFEVMTPGVLTTVQSFPGRLGYWSVGVPPSGPMDSLAFRVANRVVGNSEGAAGLELTLVGPSLRFSQDAVVALSGARLQATLDGRPCFYHEPIAVRAGQTLGLGKLLGGGMRAYLAVRGGLEAEEYLGSKATFVLGGFGGHAGRALKKGDQLRALSGSSAEPMALYHFSDFDYPSRWELAVIGGPHGAPDFFTERDLEVFFGTEWVVHHHSSRTGIRLLGPAPQWARPDGGEAGLHPSNIHDVPYAVGSVDFTGDMPIILGPDGPSLGGFVCPAVVASAELWKLGQIKPGDKVIFRAISLREAARLKHEEQRRLGLHAEAAPIPDAASSRASFARASGPAQSAEVRRSSQRLAAVARPEPLGASDIVYRRSGDSNLLVEFGPAVLDLRLRFRAHRLMQLLEEEALPGIIDLTPGIRSLQIHYDPALLSHTRLLDWCKQSEAELNASREVSVTSRVVRLPLSWDDPSIRLAIERYSQSVRADAPWAPSNIEFIRRINGLESEAAVQRIIFDASYLVLGLGDVYLGAPVATPVDPRHRLVTTKYNPARTWTPENAVGIGGAYLCVYGMEGPGGYQLFGRTLQMWNRTQQARGFEPDKPWLLRFFDRIQFEAVDAATLLEMREAFAHGRYEVPITEGQFSLTEHEAFLAENADSIRAARRWRRAAFDAERQRWKQAEAGG